MLLAQNVCPEATLPLHGDVKGHHTPHPPQQAPPIVFEHLVCLYTKYTEKSRVSATFFLPYGIICDIKHTDKSARNIDKARVNRYHTLQQDRENGMVSMALNRDRLQVKQNK